MPATIDPARVPAPPTEARQPELGARRVVPVGVLLSLAGTGAHTAPAVAHAFATTAWVAFAPTALALVPALLLPSRKEAHP